MGAGGDKRGVSLGSWLCTKNIFHILIEFNYYALTLYTI